MGWLERQGRVWWRGWQFGVCFFPGALLRSSRKQTPRQNYMQNIYWGVLLVKEKEGKEQEPMGRAYRS